MTNLLILDFSFWFSMKIGIGKAKGIIWEISPWGSHQTPLKALSMLSAEIEITGSLEQFKIKYEGIKMLELILPQGIRLANKNISKSQNENKVE